MCLLLTAINLLPVLPVSVSVPCPSTLLVFVSAALCLWAGQLDELLAYLTARCHVYLLS